MGLGFNTDPNGTPVGAQGYRVFQKFINETGSPVAGFKLSLGTGVGDGFMASGSGDGLRFSNSFKTGPNNANAYAQFPVGLFGAPNDRNDFLGGFFDLEDRSGFNMVFGEDELRTAGLFGSYGTQFGPWLTGEAVPTGVFFDDGDDDVEDPLLAWIREDGQVEQRRSVDSSGNVTALAEEAFALFDTVDAFETALGVDALFTGDIEDLANVNVNFAIDLSEFSGENFTLRVTATPVPLPATAPLLVAAIGAFAMLRRHKRGKAA